MATKAKMATKSSGKKVAKTTMRRSKYAGIKSLYSASDLTKKSHPQLWVAFPKGKMQAKGLVFSGTFTRDAIRTRMSALMNTEIKNIRCRRVKNLNK